MNGVEGRRGGSPDPRGPTGDPAWDQLEDQLSWYERRSSHAQRMYKQLKLVELVVAALVPVVAALRAEALVTAGLAAIVVVLEGTQQLYQWQTNWVLYRATAEALKRERNLYVAQAGPYRADDRRQVLAERVEGLGTEEHAKWVESRVWARSKQWGSSGGGGQ